MNQSTNQSTKLSIEGRVGGDQGVFLRGVGAEQGVCRGRGALRAPAQGIGANHRRGQLQPTLARGQRRPLSALVS